MVHSNWTWCTALALSLSLARTVYSDFVSTDYDGYNEGELGHRPHLEFQSSSEYAPILQANIWNFDAISSTGSHIFIKHDGNDSSPLSSPLILDATDLSAVYMNRTFENVFGTRVQENLGKKYLTFWEGEKGDGIGDGYGLVFDETYQLVYTVSAQNLKVHSDLHEFALTGNGTALVTGVDRRLISGDDYDSSWGIPRELDLLDAVFQEIKLETNEVLFEWRALDHVNPMESVEPRAAGWDAYHLNSIEKVRDLGPLREERELELPTEAPSSHTSTMNYPF
jgi:Arylsulfotransferase (ASST)